MKIAVIGKGKVGLELWGSLFEHHEVVLYGRDYPSEEDIAADLILIAVNDSSVAEVAANFPNTLPAHTAGAVALQPGPRSAVFYPLYSFSKEQRVDFKRVPLLLETASQGDRDVLEEVARDLSDEVYWINSAQREKLHVAAVMVNNFTNHLYTLAAEYCDQRGLPFEVLHAIMEQGPGKAKELGPKLAQTGPAVRGDQGTINKHLQELGESDLAELYQLLTHSIQKHHR